MSLLRKFWKRASLPEFVTPQMSVEDLDASFQLLRSTTADVSSAAVQAAKALQDRLDDSENRFLWTIDAIEDFVLIKDGEGRWKTLNKFGQSLFHFYHGEYYNKTDAEIALQYPHLKETLDYCQVTDRKAWATGKPSRSEEKIPYPTGHVYLDMIKSPTYEDDGSRKELIIVGRDVTEVHLKSKREKACFQALNSASDSIVILDKSGKVFFCNDQFVKSFKLDCYQSIVDKHVLEIIPNIPKYEEMWEVIRQNKQWSIKCPTTHQVLTVMPMMNGHPQPIYYVLTFKQDPEHLPGCIAH